MDTKQQLFAAHLKRIASLIQKLEKRKSTVRSSTPQGCGLAIISIPISFIVLAILLGILLQPILGERQAYVTMPIAISFPWIIAALILKTFKKRAKAENSKIVEQIEADLSTATGLCATEHGELVDEYIGHKEGLKDNWRITNALENLQEKKRSEERERSASAVKQVLAAASNTRSLDSYIDTIAAKVTGTSPWEGAGLYEHETEIHRLGVEIEANHGFTGMQYVWQGIKARKGGTSATSELTRIWDGIGRWQS